MSNIYIQEPPTSGKVLLTTSVGDIDIELWAREAPKACRNFIQLCMEGYYNGTIFHRLVKGFIVQGGDPQGDGTGGESIYGETFKDEFHSRLRFTRRGLLAMANAGKNDNGSQFFFTLGTTTELQNKHTIFGKVTGDTLYNMLKLEDGLVGEDERPMYPQKIIKAEILSNPFDDIVPRVTKKESKSKDRKQEKGVKNFGLLSFGIEAEEDEQETTVFIQKAPNKGKSTHDVLDDPKLSREAYKVADSQSKPQDTEEIEELAADDEMGTLEDRAERIRNKLKSNKRKIDEVPKSSSDSEDDYLNDIVKEKKAQKQKKVEEIQKEITSLKRQFKDDRKVKNVVVDKERLEKEALEKKSELFKEYMTEKEKYTKLKELPKKGSSREQFTLQLLSKFKSKLETAKQNLDENPNDAVRAETPSKHPKDDNDEDITGDNWLSHKLQFEEHGSVLAKDAATKEDDWYDVYDPRNPLNKRRRGESSKHHKKTDK